ncbi:hypothetical protein FY534_08180 [Alicyclobacillus sp. TC]|nr:hypothetical protein FY534_08180 [Alicyclobacillus sp. TC]
MDVYVTASGRERGRKLAFVCLAGPTAVGKSSVAIELAKQLEAEILSADSMQIYRQMDIGTGKVTPEEMQGVVHYGIDLVDPDESFSVADFVNYAKKTIANIAQRRHLPLVVGEQPSICEDCWMDSLFRPCHPVLPCVRIGKITLPIMAVRLFIRNCIRSIRSQQLVCISMMCGELCVRWRSIN